MDIFFKPRTFEGSFGVGRCTGPSTSPAARSTWPPSSWCNWWRGGWHPSRFFGWCWAQCFVALSFLSATWGWRFSSSFGWWLEFCKPFLWRVEVDVVGVGTDGNLRVWTLWAVSFKRWRGHVTLGKAGYWVKASVGTPRCWSGHLRSPRRAGIPNPYLRSASVSALRKRRHMAKSSDHQNLHIFVDELPTWENTVFTLLFLPILLGPICYAIFKVIQYFSKLYVFFSVCFSRFVVHKFNGPCWIVNNPPKNSIDLSNAIQKLRLWLQNCTITTIRQDSNAIVISNSISLPKTIWHTRVSPFPYQASLSLESTFQSCFLGNQKLRLVNGGNISSAWEASRSVGKIGAQLEKKQQ